MEAMKPRHAAALALVGWYLMMPPWRPTVDVSAPLSRWAPFNGWTTVGCIWSDYRKCYEAYTAEETEDLADCQQLQTRLKYAVIHRYRKNWWGDKSGPEDQRMDPSWKMMEVMADHSQCIEDDDQRLRGNLRYRGN
jgi:hypothetical protein